MRMIVVARCIERIGDNAVDIGEQTAFVVTGEFHEFSDASELGRASSVHQPTTGCSPPLAPPGPRTRPPLRR